MERHSVETLMENVHEVDEKSTGVKLIESTDDSNDAVRGVVRNGEVKRALKARHVSMIALGGTIGTGLFIGTATPLQNAGPVSTLISYIWMGTFVYSITQSLGEMATYIPVSGSLAVFTTRFCSPALGAANGWMYWFSWAMTFAIELNATGQIIKYWTGAVPDAAWIGIFFVILTLSNVFPVKIYGEIEFWVASIKVLAILGWLIYAFIMVCGAGKTGPIGFRYWRNPGPWGPGYLVKSNMNTARFLGWLSSLINATFTYQGTELVGISAGEAANPRKNVPRAINKVMIRIVFFYILSILFMGLLIPYNDPQLNSDAHYTSSSPFVIAIMNCGTPVLPHIFTAVILITIISAGNSNIYIGSRILYGLAEAGVAPKIFHWTTPWGTPIVGVIFTALFGLLSFMATTNSASTVFNWFVNITAVAGMISWTCISFSHLRFMKALKAKNISRDDLPFKSKFQPFSSTYSFGFITFIILIQGFDSFFDFTATKFLTAYLSVFLFIFCWAIFQFVIFRKWGLKRFLYKPEEVDLDSGRREADAIVWEETPPRNLWEKFWTVVA